MNFALMTQKRCDYQQYESNLRKSVFEKKILRNNFILWVITKIANRNDPAYINPRYLVWDIGVQNGKPSIQEGDFISKTMLSEEITYK